MIVSKDNKEDRSGPGASQPYNLQPGVYKSQQLHHFRGFQGQKQQSITFWGEDHKI